MGYESPRIGMKTNGGRQDCFFLFPFPFSFCFCFCRLLILSIASDHMVISRDPDVTHHIG